MTESIEARRFPRMLFNGEIDLNDPNGDTDGSSVRASDLSAGGLRVYCLTALGTGRRVEMAFLQRNVRVHGITRHESPGPKFGWHVGIEFTEPQPELVEVIERLNGG
jgi:PilZ domain